MDILGSHSNIRFAFDISALVQSISEECLGSERIIAFFPIISSSFVIISLTLTGSSLPKLNISQPTGINAFCIPSHMS